MARLEVGAQFGDLLVEREIGHGAYGTVYLARDTLIGRHVALKVIEVPPTTRSGERRRLLDEARVVGRLRGPHVVTLYRVHTLPDEQGWVLEMEYVDGGSLQDLLGDGEVLPPDDALAVARGVLAGLQEAHERDIVHGDVKPGNVLLTGGGAVKLADFGLARLVGDMTLPRGAGSELLGTPVYMAPEVVMGQLPERASDLWSAGVVFYRMLAGRAPFPGNSLPALFYAIENLDPAPLGTDAPPALADLTMRCLAKSPRERPASCEAALADLSDRRAPAPPPPRRTPTPVLRPPRVFGREKERQRLRVLAREAAAGEGRTVLVTGDVGAGKSALAHEAEAFGRRFGFRWVEARVTVLQGLLRPLLTGLREAVAGPEGPDHALDSRLFGTATNLLRALVGEEGPVRIESRQQVVWGVEDLLAGLAKTGPLGVVIDDAHLVDDEDRALLLEITRCRADAPVLFLLLARADAASRTRFPELLARAGVAHLHLAPLDREAVAAALRDRADGARIAPEVVERLLEIAEGNPLFSIELFAHLRATQAVARDGDTIVPGPRWREVSLPGRLRELVTARVRGLPDEQRMLLDVAAVDGVQFDGEAIVTGADRPVLDVLRALQRVYRDTELVVPLPRGYRFVHAIVQEGLYEELAPDLRRAMHHRLAEHYESRPDAAPERLALHWERAGEPDRARPHLLRACRGAFGRVERLRALDFARRAGLLAERLDDDARIAHADLLLDLALLQRDLGRVAEAERSLAPLLAAAQRRRNEALVLEILVVKAMIAFQARGRAGLDEEELRSAADRLPGGTLARGRAHYLLGTIAKHGGDLDAAEASFRRADEDFVACGEMRPHSSALDQLGSVALRRGRWRKAEALYADAARISAQAGHRPNAAISEVNACVAAFARGALDGLAARLERAVEVLVRHGDELHVAHARIHVAEVRYALGDLAGAKAIAQEALPPLRQARYLTGLVSGVLVQAYLWAYEGTLERARLALAEARRLAALVGEGSSGARTRQIGVHVACFFGDLPAAARAAGEAREVVAAMDGVAPRLELAFYLGEAASYVLPRRALDGIDPLLDAEADSDRPYVEVARALVAGARAWDDEARAPEALHAAAEALRRDLIGPRRAALRVAAALFDAAGALRGGDSGTARATARDALDQARALGNVWLAAAARRLLARAGEDRQREALAEQLRRIGATLPPVERDLLLETWGANR